MVISHLSRRLAFQAKDGNSNTTATTLMQEALQWLPRCQETPATLNSVRFPAGTLH